MARYLFLILLCTAVLSGCSKSDGSKQEASSQPSQSTSPTVSAAPSSPATSEKPNSLEASSPADKSLIYKNQGLGFELTFPDSWRDAYAIEEWDGGISIYFVGKSEVSKDLGSEFQSPIQGLYFFSIGTEEANEEYLDLMDDVTEIGTVNGNKLLYFTGTDCTVCVLAAFQSESAAEEFGEEELALMQVDWEMVEMMKEEIPLVLKTFKASK